MPEKSSDMKSKLFDKFYDEQEDRNYCGIKQFFRRTIRNVLDNSFSIILSILGLWLAIYLNNQNTYDATKLRIGEDFSKILTMNSERKKCFETSLLCNRLASDDEYKWTLKLNYKLNSDFILNKLKYKKFSNFKDTIEEASMSNPKDLEKINHEIIELLNKIVE